MLQLFQQERYDRTEILNVFEEAFDKAGVFNSALKDKKRILLKPNFVIPEKKEGGSTTNPDFYMTLASFLQSKGFEVGVGDSPAFGSCQKALSFHGVLDECRDKNIEVVEFISNEKYEGVAGTSYANLTIAAELQDWDAIINLPKVKVHQQFMFTGAAKNLYGCVAGKRKFYRHNTCKNDPVRFAKMIIANAHKAACVLHIGDGIEAMHVKGPRGGEIYPLGKIIFSDDFHEHDWLMCKLIGLDPMITHQFKALDSAERKRVEEECQTIINGPCFSVAENFIQSYRTDISFSPWHLLRTGWRSFKFKLQRA